MNIDHLEKPMVTNHPKRSHHMLTIDQLKKPVATIARYHPKKSQHILAIDQLDKPMVTSHPKRSHHTLNID